MREEGRREGHLNVFIGGVRKVWWSVAAGEARTLEAGRRPNPSDDTFLAATMPRHQLSRVTYTLFPSLIYVTEGDLRGYVTVAQ